MIKKRKNYYYFPIFYCRCIYFSLLYTSEPQFLYSQRLPNLIPHFFFHTTTDLLFPSKSIRPPTNNHPITSRPTNTSNPKLHNPIPESLSQSQTISQSTSLHHQLSLSARFTMRIPARRPRSPSPEVVPIKKKRGQATADPPPPKPFGRSPKKTVPRPPKQSALATAVLKKKQQVTAAPPPSTSPNNKGTKPVHGTRKKAKSKAGGATLPPSESQLRGYLEFPNAEHKARYDKLVLRPFSPYKAFHGLTFNNMGISEEASDYLHNIGWENLWEYDYPVYVELTYEFFATFWCDGKKIFTWDTPNMIRFRLMGKEFSWSYYQFNVSLGVMDTDLGASPVLIEPYGGFPTEFHEDTLKFWKELTNNHPEAGQYDSRYSKALFIADPSLRIIHKWLALSLFSRPKGGNLVTKNELFLLWCMKREKKADFARWLVPQIQDVIHSFDQPLKRNLSFGSFITCIAVHEGLIDECDTDLHVRCKAEFLDVPFLTKHNIVRKTKDTGLQFVPPGETVRDKHKQAGASSSLGDEAAVGSSPTHEEFKSLAENVAAIHSRLDAQQAQLDKIEKMVQEFIDKAL